MIGMYRNSRRHTLGSTDGKSFPVFTDIINRVLLCLQHICSIQDTLCSACSTQLGACTWYSSQLLDNVKCPTHTCVLVREGMAVQQRLASKVPWNPPDGQIARR